MRLLYVGLWIVWLSLTPQVWAANTTTYNPFTNKLDYVTDLTTLGNVTGETVAATDMDCTIYGNGGKVTTDANGNFECAKDETAIDSANILFLDGANIHFIPTTTNINTYIDSSAVTSGDAIVLAAGTYTVTAPIDSSKSISLIGQGPTQTIINSATNDLNIFLLQHNNIRLSNFGITSTGGGTTTRAIDISGAGTPVLTGIVIDHITITMSGSGSQTCLRTNDANTTIRDFVCNATSSSSIARGIHMQTNTTAEANTTTNVYEANVSTTTTAVSINYPFYCQDASGSNDATLNIYNSRGISTDPTGTSFGAASENSDCFVNVYHSTLSGADADVGSVTSGNITLYDSVLVNGTLSGTVLFGGSDANQHLIVNASATVTGEVVTWNNITSRDTGDLGWSVSNAVNQACNTTCTYACVIGIDNATTAFLACTDASADSCLCAGPN